MITELLRPFWCQSKDYAAEHSSVGFCPFLKDAVTCNRTPFSLSSIYIHDKWNLLDFGFPILWIGNYPLSNKGKRFQTPLSLLCFFWHLALCWYKVHAWHALKAKFLNDKLILSLGSGMACFTACYLHGRGALHWTAVPKSLSSPLSRSKIYRRRRWFRVL